MKKSQLAFLYGISCLEDMCIRELEKRYLHQPTQQQQQQQQQQQEKEAKEERGVAWCDLDEGFDRDVVRGVVTLCDSSDDEDDYEDDTWMSVSSGKDGSDGEDHDNKGDGNDDDQDEGLIEGHLQEEDEDEDEDIYRELLPHRDDHVLCNFAISCVYRGNASVSPSISTGVGKGWSGLGSDHVEALNTLQMIIDLQIQAPMSRAAL